MSPSVIFSVSFVAMSNLAFICQEYLELNLQGKTVAILSLGGFLFILVEFIITLFYKNNYIFLHKKNHTFLREKIYVDKKLVKLETIILFVSIGMGIIQIMLISSGSINSRMSTLRELMIYDSSAIPFRFFASQIYKINTALIYLFSYIMIYNIYISKDNPKAYSNYIINLLLYLFYSIVFSGGRQGSIELIIYMLLIYAFFLTIDFEIKKIFRLIKKIVPIAVVIAVVFTKTAELVGRRIAERHVLTYIAAYFCGGLYAFDHHINEPARTKFWGQATFTGIYKYLIQWGIVPEAADSSYQTFDRWGNTYTIFGHCYEDFGIIGIVMMSVLASFVFSMLFYRVVRKKEAHLSNIIYCDLLVNICLAAYDDHIATLISVKNFVIYSLIAVLYFLIVRYQLTIGNMQIMYRRN